MAFNHGLVSELQSWDKVLDNHRMLKDYDLQKKSRVPGQEDVAMYRSGVMSRLSRDHDNTLQS